MTSASYGIAMPSSRGVLTPPVLCAQAVAFFDRLSTQPSSSRKVLYNTLITSLVNAGVWAKLDALYMLAAADRATALTNLMSSSYGATAINTPAFTADQSFAFNGSSSYLSSGFDPTAGSPHFSQNSASAGLWLYAPAPSGNPWSMGNAVAGNAGVKLQVSRPQNANVFASLNSSLSSALPQTAANTFYAITRVGSASFDVYVASSKLATVSNASQVLASDTVTFGKAGASFSADSLSAAFIGGGLTSGDIAALYDAVHTYLQAIAGVT